MVLLNLLVRQLQLVGLADSNVAIDKGKIDRIDTKKTLRGCLTGKTHPAQGRKWGFNSQAECFTQPPICTIVMTDKTTPTQQRVERRCRQISGQVIHCLLWPDQARKDECQMTREVGWSRHPCMLTSQPSHLVRFNLNMIYELLIGLRYTRAQPRNSTSGSSNPPSAIIAPSGNLPRLSPGYSTRRG